MINYICNHCNTPFDEPQIINYTENLGEFQMPVSEERCPICGCDSFTAAEECPKCEGAKPLPETLCKKCRKSLKERFIAFADELTAEEEEQLDDWLDGDIVENRRNWT